MLLSLQEVAEFVRINSRLGSILAVSKFSIVASLITAHYNSGRTFTVARNC